MALVRKVSIENYKSIRKLTLELGRINVLIGANGAGKSNILEAVTLGCAAARNKLDNEYLAPRGIRVTEPRFMRSAFPGTDLGAPVVVSLRQQDGPTLRFPYDTERRTFAAPGPPFPTMAMSSPDLIRDNVVAEIEKRLASDPRTRQIADKIGSVEALQQFLIEALTLGLPTMLPPEFLIYSPENSALRIFQTEPQILPLGIRGEGLFAHLKALSASDHGERLAEIGDRLALLDWFERLEIPKDLAPGERSLLIRDRYLAEGALFDQRSANEGFLFLLFYLTVFITDSTPSFFAIDNVDASLNPKLVTTLIQQLVELARKHDKQVIFTTHNPAVLDGINLGDDEQRLFVTDRGKDGATRARRAQAPKPLDGEAPVPLSEAFVRGYLGGLPKNF